MDATKDTLGIVIVNWNTGPLLRLCLASLASLPERECITDVVVIDNASTDDSMIQAKTDITSAVPVQFIVLPANVGFARANNQGIAALRGVTERTHVLLLNPDTEVKAGALAALLDRLTARPRAAVIGPQLLYPDGRVQPSVRRLPTLGVLLIMYLRLYWIWPQLRLWQQYLAADMAYDREQEVEQVMGAAFLIRREVLTLLGPLDAQFSPYWFEEVDYCARVRQNGWEVVYTPLAQIIHHGGVSFGQVVGWRKSWPWLANGWRYARKHLGVLATSILTILMPIALLLATAGMWRHFLSQDTGVSATTVVPKHHSRK